MMKRLRLFTILIGVMAVMCIFARWMPRDRHDICSRCPLRQDGAAGRGAHHTSREESKPIVARNDSDRHGNGCTREAAIASNSSTWAQDRNESNSNGSVSSKMVHHRSESPVKLQFQPRLLINQPSFCYNESINGLQEDVFLLVLMPSPPNKYEMRRIHRESCLSLSYVAGKKVKSLFFLGYSGDRVVMEKVQQEAEQHGDIVMEDFLDSYRNLTLKTLLGLKWANEYCPQTEYIMKADDGTYISIVNIVEHLMDRPRKRFVTGLCFDKAKPIRNKKHRWYLSNRDYRARLFPPYCAGAGYVLSGDLIPQIILASWSMPYIFLEDVYLGLCLETLEVVPESDERFISNWQDYSYCPFKSAFVVHVKKPNEITEYWSDQNNEKNKTCS